MIDLRPAEEAPSLGAAHVDFVVYVKQRSFCFSLKTGERYLVGREESCQIRIDSPSVSRQHLALSVADGRVWVEELGSSNGTQLCQKGPRHDGPDRVSLNPGRQHELREGDVLRLGSVTALLRAVSPLLETTHSTLPPSTYSPGLRNDAQVLRVYELAHRAAKSDISVLIFGETGSGKELLASSIHENSLRCQAPMLKLNCAALSENLLESELFGHEKGAFTGANTHRLGLLESTRGGTVFLDELGEMPLSTQAKLLRVLEERKIRRLGSNKSIPIDVRFVAATNRDMNEEVEEGRFRGDLFYRIGGIVLSLPPLRERSGEIEPLARHFLREFCIRSKLEVPDLSSEGVAALRAYSWPGNVRELKNAMERASILSAGRPIVAEHLPIERNAMPSERGETEGLSLSSLPPPPSLRDAGARDGPRFSAYPRSGPVPEAKQVDQAPRSSRDTDPVPSVAPRLVHGNSQQYSARQERAQILDALEKCSGNQTRAAKRLGVSRRTLINRLERLQIARPRKQG